MTAQQVEPVTVDTFAAASAAATAAITLIPSAHPLTVSPSPGQRPAGEATAFVATFTGSVSGEVLLVLHDDVAAALTAGTVDLELADAVRPALEAAASSTGPTVLGPVRTAPVDDVAPAGGRMAVVTLLGGGAPAAWLGMSVRDGADDGPAIPRQPGTGAGGAGTGAAMASGMGTGTAASTGQSSGHGAGGGGPLSGLGLHLLQNVEMVLSVEIGRARMTVRDLLALAPGSVVELDRAAGAPADLLVNGRLIARGEVVVVDEDFGLRITELVQPAGENTA